MFLDLVLAIVHHVLIFALVAILTVELVLVRDGMTGADVRRVAAIDLWYGILAAAILAVGFARAVFAAKGWAYYSTNAFFWVKIATFLAIGILSIGPTIQIIGWRGAQRRGETDAPPNLMIARVRRLLWAEAALFALLPVFAAAMARGYG